MTFKEKYCKYNEKIHPEQSLVNEILTAAREKESNRSHWGMRATRGFATVGAICFCLYISIPVLAANVDPIYQVMYAFSPEIAQHYRLIQKSDESQGIRMEVISTYVHDNEIQAYIALQDLEGDRIDETADLNDSYSINAPFSTYGSGGYQCVEYDAETSTATFLITIGLMSEKFMDETAVIGDKITFSVKEFISHKAEYEDLEVLIPLSEAELSPETMMLWIKGGSAPVMKQLDENMPARYADMLSPQEPDKRLDVEGIQFTGMGYIDGMLHIQTAVPYALNNDNHCELFLVDGNGEKRMYDYKISGWGDTKESNHISYQDCIFDISAEELENYTLHGHFVTSGIQVEGNWSVTFPIE